MSERDDYPAGVPCWVDTSQPDVGVAKDFYAAVFGWDYDGPGPMPESDNGGYWVAQSNGRAVAGIAALPPGMPLNNNWNTYCAR